MTTLLGKKHEAHCWRIGQPVTLEDGLCPECGWRDNDPKTDPGLQVGPGQTGLDQEIAELVWALNRLPGIKTCSSCSGHRKEPLKIWFDVEDYKAKGLLVLSRLLSANYYRFYQYFSVTLDHQDTDPQVCFRFESKTYPSQIHDDAFWDDLFEGVGDIAHQINAIVDDTITHHNILYGRTGGGSDV